MHTYTQTLYHIAFGTLERGEALAKDGREDLYRYIWGVLREKGCHLYRIGGTADHVHILTSLHPSLALAGLVKDTKLASSQWMRKRDDFPEFERWQEGYGAFTVGAGGKDALIAYIRKQEEHHRKLGFRDELARLLDEAGVEYDERYLP